MGMGADWSDRVRAFSFGGGVQSMAALVLAARGRIPYRFFIFANVGEDSENPATLRYFREYAQPYALDHRLVLLEVRRQHRDGTPDTVYSRLVGETRSIGIPVRMANGAPGRRACTTDFKIRVIASQMRRMGCTREWPGLLALGISLDEMTRMRTKSDVPWYELDYPLVAARLSRADCAGIIAEEGLPVPPKSSCWFCPYHTIGAWREMHRSEPNLWRRAVRLEKDVNEKRKRLGLDPVYFNSRSVPLRKLVAGDALQDGLWQECESGYCGV